MANERRLLGQFLKKRISDPDDPDDLYAPGGNINPQKSFLELDLREDLTPHLPGPPLAPAELPVQPPPALSNPSELSFQKGPLTPLAAEPAGPYVIADPPTAVPMQLQPSPPLASPAEIPSPPAVTLSVVGPENAIAGHLPEIPDPLPPPPFPDQAGAAELPDPPAVKNNPASSPKDAPPSTKPPIRFPPAGPYIPSQDKGGPAFNSPHRDSPEILDGGKSTVDSLPERLKQVDSNLAAALQSMGQDQYANFVKLPVNTQGDLAIDPLLFGKHIARLGSHMGESGLGIFAGMQVALFAQNRRGRIWNPMLAAPPPILQNYIPPALDLPDKEVAGFPARDIHLAMAQGTYDTDSIGPVPPFYDKQVRIGSGAPAPSAMLVGAQSQNSSLVDDVYKVPGPLVPVALKERNLYTPDAPFSENASFLQKNLVDQSIADGNTDKAKSDLKKIFLNERRGVNAMEFRPNPARSRSNVTQDPLVKSAFTNGVIPVKFRGENKFGFSTFQEGRGPSIDDDEAYVPLSFTDLRPIGNRFRTVYFRPFLTQLSEGFAPEWGEAGYYGRVDPVVSYAGTTRVINLGFQIVAFSPEDVEMIYRKLTWLSSMVYPEYDKDLIYSSGPVCRMRIGDVINARGPEGGLGLPGIIKTLDFDYTKALWELKKDMKVPRNIQVTLSFLVLHDRPIGRGEEGRFGGIGKIINGKYVPPGVGDQKSGGNDHLKFAEVDNVDSFRAVGGKNVNLLNEYSTLEASDKE